MGQLWQVASVAWSCQQLATVQGWAGESISTSSLSASLLQHTVAADCPCSLLEALRSPAGACISLQQAGRFVHPAAVLHASQSSAPASGSVSQRDTLYQSQPVPAGLWSLEDLDNPETAKVLQQAQEQPDLFVLKPQREGGGNNLYGEEMLEKLRQRKGLAAYILMQRIRPPIRR